LGRFLFFCQDKLLHILFSFVGLTQYVVGEAEYATLSGHNSFSFSPVMLQLLTGLSFEAYGLICEAQERPFSTADMAGNVDNMSTMNAHLLYHE